MYENGVVATALDAFGQAVLAHPAWAGFTAASGRGSGRSPLDALRGFLGPLKGTAEACSVGALRFDAHRLAGSIGLAVDAASDSPALGVFYFAPTLLRRDAVGTWERVDLVFADAALADTRGNASVPAAVPAAAAIGHRGRRLVDDDFQPGGYATVVERAVQMLARGPLVSLTLSQSFRRPAHEHRAAAAFENLRRANPAPATFFFHTSDTGERVFGASPDLQLRVQGRDVEAFPVLAAPWRVATGRSARPTPSAVSSTRTSTPLRLPSAAQTRCAATWRRFASPGRCTRRPAGRWRWRRSCTPSIA